MGGTEKCPKHQRSTKKVEARGQRRAEEIKGSELESIPRVGGSLFRQESGMVNFGCQLVAPQEDRYSGSLSLST